MTPTTARATKFAMSIAREPNRSVRTPACGMSRRIGSPETEKTRPTAAAEPVTPRTYQPSAALNTKIPLVPHSIDDDEVAERGVLECRPADAIESRVGPAHDLGGRWGHEDHCKSHWMLEAELQCYASLAMGYAASTTRTGRDGMIDLRSDTVTLPSPAMRRAMAEAEVGDDVFGEDPTVRALEERSAELLGAEAGLLVASGTMGNLVGLMAHVPRGGEIIGPADIHTFSSEGAGHAVIAGASVRMIPWADDGTMDLADVRAAVRDPNDVHEPITSMLTIENSHALSMGQPLPPAYVASVADVAREIGVPLFIDGARLFNAAVALGVPARDLVPAGCLGDVLPVEEPRLPGRVGGRRRCGVHRSRPARAQDGRWRDAPGRGHRRGRASSRCRTARTA